jgi:hypothetical protein
LLGQVQGVRDVSLGLQLTSHYCAATHVTKRDLTLLKGCSSATTASMHSMNDVDGT